jgi:hypothetical protein
MWPIIRGEDPMGPKKKTAEATNKDLELELSEEELGKVAGGTLSLERFSTVGLERKSFSFGNTKINPLGGPKS